MRGGMAYMNAQQHGASGTEALMDALIAGSPLGESPQRAQSAKLVGTAILGAVTAYAASKKGSSSKSLQQTPPPVRLPLLQPNRPPKNPLASNAKPDPEQSFSPLPYRPGFFYSVFTPTELRDDKSLLEIPTLFMLKCPRSTNCYNELTG